MEKQRTPKDLGYRSAKEISILFTHRCHCKAAKPNSTVTKCTAPDRKVIRKWEIDKDEFMVTRCQLAENVNF